MTYREKAGLILFCVIMIVVFCYVSAVKGNYESLEEGYADLYVDYRALENEYADKKEELYEEINSLTEDYQFIEENYGQDECEDSYIRGYDDGYSDGTSE